MKKNLFTTLFFLVLHLYGSAQVAVVNKKGTVTEIDSSKWTLSGSNIFNKNTGNVGLGNPSPTYKFDVTGKARISDSLLANTVRIITLNAGSLNDSIIVSDPSSGILKRIAPSRLNIEDSTSASNGLTLVGKDVRIGGALINPSTITTTSVNTLAINGLQSGTANDSLVAADATSGILRRVEQRRKPTVIKTTATQANSTVTAATITTLFFTTIANKNYKIKLWLIYSSAATTTGIRLGPNAFSGGNYWYQVFVPSSTTANQFFSGFNTGTMLVSSSSRATTGNVAIIEMDIEATSAATLSFQFASEVAGSAITIQANSRLEYEITN